MLNLKELNDNLKNIGMVSDGYHTFDELYYHRMILFKTICGLFKERAWKSRYNSDGSSDENWFIVGIDTPKGQFTYHYHIKYWDLFADIKELDVAPQYDGHIPDDVIRLLSLLED